MMYLEEVSFLNYKAVKELRIELTPGINLLVGDNGAGKTSVLDGIASALGAFFINVEGVSTKNIAKEDVHVDVHTVGDNSKMISYCEPVSVGCTLKVNSGEFTWNRIKEQISSTYTKTDDRAVCAWMKEMTNKHDTCLPLLSYQSAARVWRVKRGDFGNELKKKLDDRRCGYIGCLDSSMDVKAIQQWCMHQEIAAFNKGKQIGEYETFKKIIATFMKEINELEYLPQIYYLGQFGEMVYRDEKVEMAISKLSAGYQSLLWMIMDLAYRVALLNPELGELSELEGIVLIDEIDMHLHPKWQWNIIKALQTTFPKVQFIITTHSPIVISSAKGANLIHLEEAEPVTYLPDSYGYAVEDILRFRQESDKRPRWIMKHMDAVEEALEKEDFVKAESVLQELKGVLGEENTEYKRVAGIVSDAKLLSDIF